MYAKCKYEEEHGLLKLHLEKKFDLIFNLNIISKTIFF